MTPDIELLVCQHLAAHLDGVRIGTRTPSTTQEPWLRVTLIDDLPEPSSPALHLIDAQVQIDCYAGADRGQGHAQASLLARTVRQVMHDMPGQTAGNVVSRVKTVGMHRLPDTGFDPARERFVLDVTVTAHG